jgi:N-acetylglucosamine-6-phosphate deacetylase
MQRAMENGCSLITHLYSCTSTITRDHGFRRLGVIETAYLCDDMDVEIIADGKHLPPELIRMIIKIKGAEHVALVTDSLAIAGTDITEGVMSGTPFIVEDGVCKLADRSALAGSIATMDRLLRTMVFKADIPLMDAVRMSSETPARIMGILDRKGTLEKGKDADIVMYNKALEVQCVWSMGKIVEGTNKLG